MNILLPIIAVAIGIGIALLIKANSGAIKLLLSFSGAFLLSITVFEFLPEVYEKSNKLVGLFIMLGILLQVILEFLSKGAEHGHLHSEDEQKVFPWAVFIGLCLHSLLEGFPIKENFHLLLGVVIHKIPISIIIASFLLNSKMKKSAVIFFLCIFALMSPLGSYIQVNISALDNITPYINALVVGIFLHVSTTILFETSKTHKFNTTKLISIVLGIILAFFL